MEELVQGQDDSALHGVDLEVFLSQPLLQGVRVAHGGDVPQGGPEAVQSGPDPLGIVQNHLGVGGGGGGCYGNMFNMYSFTAASSMILMI